MPRRVLRREFWHTPSHARLMVACCLVASSLLVGVFWFRGFEQASINDKICRKVDRLDAAIIHMIRTPQRIPPTPARQRVLDRIVADLEAAACDPQNLDLTP